MGITVEEALTIPPFNKSKVMAGAGGLNRIVNSVSAMDAPDLFNWIRGNELILTSGYFVKHLSIYEQIMKVNVKGAAALAIKLNRYVDTIDEEVISLADQLKFPLISLPFEYGWVDFVTPLVSAIVDKKTAEIEHSKRISESFTNIVLEGGDFDLIIRSLSKVLNKKCALFDKKNNLICADPDPLLQWQDIIQKHSDILRKTNDVVCHRIIHIENKQFSLLKCEVRSGQDNYGNIFVIFDYRGTGPSDWDIIALQQVATILCLEFQKRKAVETVEKSYKESFLNDILLGLITDSEVIESKSNFLGLNIKQGGTVIVVNFDNKHVNVNSRLVFQMQARKICEYSILGTNANMTFIADQIVVLIPYGCDIYKIIHAITDNFSDKLPKNPFKVGVGRTFGNVRKIAQSYKDANNVIRIGHYYQETILDYKRLGVIRLILENVSQDDINDYFYEYLGPILSYQRENNIDLIETLAAYYQNDCNIRSTAKKLFIHFNTVKYRLNLIKDILQIDIDEPDVKNTLSIALKFKNIINKSE